ncbi:MAG: DegT/DnrJ/EryC1/StrS family aminotransferase [Planctomycetota bacterium]
MNDWRIPLSRPDIDASDRAAVLRVLDTPWLSLGPENDALESEFSEFFGGLPVATVANGTAGLFLALRALGFRGGQVLTPSFGFIGTAHAIRLAGGEPRFVEVSPETLCVTPETLDEAYTPECRAVLPVDVFGTPLAMENVAAWARDRGLLLVEDACEALGARRSGQRVGTMAPASVFAFYPNKQMTTGEGGLVVCQDPNVAGQIRSRRNQGRGPGEFQFVGEGFNFRLTEMQAGLGRSQLRRLPSFLEQRRRVATDYNERLAEVPGLAVLPAVPAGDERSWFVFVVFVEQPEWRARARAALAERGIQTAPYFPAIHDLGGYRDPGLRGSPLRFTSEVSSRSFAIPFHNRLEVSEIDEVCETLATALRGLGGTHGFSLQTLPALTS